MAAFGAGLLDDPLAASDWDTDGFFALKGDTDKHFYNTDISCNTEG